MQGKEIELILRPILTKIIYWRESVLCKLTSDTKIVVHFDFSYILNLAREKHENMSQSTDGFRYHSQII